MIPLHAGASRETVCAYYAADYVRAAAVAINIGITQLYTHCAARDGLYAANDDVAELRWQLAQILELL